MFSQYFDKVYCIHLPNERERKGRIQKQFDDMGFTDVNYISATPPPANFSMSNMRRNSRGEFGVNLSQIKAVVQAISDGAQRPLFFEDDIEFKDYAGRFCNYAIQELPEDWGVLYFGGHPRGPVPARRAVSQGREYVYKIQRYSFADAYSINGKYLQKFFDYWCEFITRDNAMYDFILGEFAGQNNGYAVYPTLCEQYAGKSAVTGQFDDKSSIVARAWASHIGPQKLHPDHKEIFKEWKAKNPGQWEASLKRMAKKK